MTAETQRPAPLPTGQLLESFSEDEIRRLHWVRGTLVAEQHLVPWGQPCPDHQACRRLAFALWLRCIGRVSETDLSHKT